MSGSVWPGSFAPSNNWFNVRFIAVSGSTPARGPGPSSGGSGVASSFSNLPGADIAQPLAHRRDFLKAICAEQIAAAIVHIAFARQWPGSAKKHTFEWVVEQSAGLEFGAPVPRRTLATAPGKSAGQVKLAPRAAAEQN